MLEEENMPWHYACYQNNIFNLYKGDCYSAFRGWQAQVLGTFASIDTS